MTTHAAVVDDGSERRWWRDTWPIRRREAGLLVSAYVALVAGWSALGWLLKEPLRDSAVVRADEDLAEWFAARRTPSWDTASLWGSRLSETIVKIVLTAVVGLVLLRRTRRWYEALLASVPLMLEAAVFLTTTLVVGRPRPNVPRLDGSPVSTSFPSGHVAAAVCYAAFVVVAARRGVRRALVWLLGAVVVTVSVVVGLARMYRGMHHLTDVLAGVAIGVMCVLIVAAILDRSAPAPGHDA